MVLLAYLVIDACEMMPFCFTEPWASTLCEALQRPNLSLLGRLPHMSSCSCTCGLLMSLLVFVPRALGVSFMFMSDWQVGKPLLLMYTISCC